MTAFLFYLVAFLALARADAASEQQPSAAGIAAAHLRALALNGTGSWGTRGDLMGLLVRLPFHDGATYNGTDGGSDGCVDLQSPENNGLKEAIDLLETVRAAAAAQAAGPGLSRADLWALAGNVMIEAAGGPALEFKVGRVDVANCAGQGARHVDAESRSSVRVAEVFVERLNFTHREVVALMGAHVLGRLNLANSGYEGQWVQRNDRFTNAYFADLLQKPWVRTEADVAPFGKRTTWRVFEDSRMNFGPESMLQTDVDLAFETTTGRRCSRVGGVYRRATSCLNATHAFASHVWEFAADEAAWLGEFEVAWAKLTSMTNAKLTCAVPGCKTPYYEKPPDTTSSVRSRRTGCGFLIAVAAAIGSAFLLGA